MQKYCELFSKALRGITSKGNVRRITIYFPRWKFPNNLGDCVVFSSVIKMSRTLYPNSSIKVISDSFVIESLSNNPYVDRFSLPSLLERLIPTRCWLRASYKKGNGMLYNGRGRMILTVFPHYNADFYHYLAQGNTLQGLINNPRDHIIATHYAWQLGDAFLDLPDKSYEIFLTDEDRKMVKHFVPRNAIGLSIATRRKSMKIYNQDRYRYPLEKWRKIAEFLRNVLPGVHIVEVGTDRFHRIGDSYLGYMSLKDLAACIERMKLVILTDGGINNVCNAIGKQTLLFQGFEYLDPDLFKMWNSFINYDYHLACRKTCDINAKIRNVPDPKPGCGLKCTNTDPEWIAGDAVILYRQN